MILIPAVLYSLAEQGWAGTMALWAETGKWMGWARLFSELALSHNFQGPGCLPFKQNKEPSSTRTHPTTVSLDQMLPQKSHTQWSEIFPSEDLGGNPGTCTGEHGASYARTWTPCLLRGGAGQDTPSWGSTVSASLSPAAAVVQELEKPACLPAAASSRLTWAHVCQYIRIFLKNNIPRGPGMSQQDRVGRRV